ncbi:Rop guanine nucleotide exchange factor 10 [Raphanus sativus]|nr:Rop guanine nucleotide exchange factor 10 [Raphanus sativus]
MVRSLGRKVSWPRSFSFRKMFDGWNSGHSSFSSRGDGRHTPEHELAVHATTSAQGTRGKQNRTSDMEVMKARFAKLLLGEDMSGGSQGVTSALALSNAITNLADSVFGEQMKLQPMYPETKKTWRKEMDWLLSVVDHIVQFVPSKQMGKNGAFTEIMVTKQRDDLLLNIPALRKLDSVLLETLDNFKDQKDFWYIPRDVEDTENNGDWRRDENWWLPVVKVPSDGLSEESRKLLQSQKDSVAQVLKAATAINDVVLSEMNIPDNYIESLPKNGKTSLGDFLYKIITDENFDPDYFLSFLDLSTEHKVLDLKNRIEASMWGSSVSLEKRELFEVRAETILVMLKQQYPGIPQSSLEVSKIKNNKDIGQAILESYSRVLESIASKIMSRIEDILQADALVQRQLMAGSAESGVESEYEETEKMESAETPNSRKLSELIGWRLSSDTKKHCSMSDIELFHRTEQENNMLKSPRALEKPMKMKSPRALPKKLSFLAKLENMRSPNERH